MQADSLGLLTLGKQKLKKDSVTVTKQFHTHTHKSRQHLDGATSNFPFKEKYNPQVRMECNSQPLIKKTHHIKL